MTAQSIASSVARSVSQSVAGIGSGGYDAAALDYFTRAEALGGDFDRTAINAAYTSAYVKAAISAFVAGCKTDSIWTKLTEVYLMAGVSFGGLMAKLKYSSVATLTNVNFVSGDYVGAGSGGGMKGAIGKYLDTEFNCTSLGSVNAAGFSYYTTASGTSGTRLSGAIDGSGNSFCGDSPYNLTQITGSIGNSSYRTVSTAWTGSGFVTATRISSTNNLLFLNGSQVNQNTGSNAATLPNLNFYLMGTNTNGSLGFVNDDRKSCYILHSGLTATDAANLSLRVNALMTALGANVY